MKENTLKSFRENIIIEFIQLKKGTTLDLTSEINFKLKDYAPGREVTERTIQTQIKELKLRGLPIEKYTPSDEEIRLRIDRLGSSHNIQSKRGIQFLKFADGYQYSPSLTKEEELKVNDAFIILSRFVGQPGWEFLEEFIELGSEVLPFAQDFEKQFYNPIDSNRFPKLYRELKYHMINKEVVQVNRYNNQRLNRVEFHPHYVKYWKDKWYFFGASFDIDKKKSLETYVLPLDNRIKEIKALPKANFLPCKVQYSEELFENYFKEILGVTNDKSISPEEIIFKITNKEIEGILNSKHIHDTFKKISKDERLYSIRVKQNRELIRFFQEYIDSIQVISPLSLKEEIRKTLQKALSNYTK